MCLMLLLLETRWWLLLLISSLKIVALERNLGLGCNEQKVWVASAADVVEGRLDPEVW